MNTPSAPDPGPWRRGVARFLDLLYPASCALCSVPLTHGRSLCSPCAAGLPRITEPFCESCGEAFPGQIDGPFACPNCTDISFSFDFARPSLLRDERTLDLIHRLKYGREIHLAAELSILADEAFLDPRFSRALAEKWPLVPVPLHPRRLRHRHFNQAAEIARGLSVARGLPVLTALRRVRPTDTQTMLGRRQRMSNLRGAFEATSRVGAWLEHGARGAVLVDDVLTTGSTVNECARILRGAGFLHVQVLTVMRG